LAFVPLLLGETDFGIAVGYAEGVLVETIGRFEGDRLGEKETVVIRNVGVDD
jgi:hypothetical protein